MGRRSRNRVLRTISLWTLLAGLFVGLTTDGLASEKWDGQWIGTVISEDPEGCKFDTKPEKISVAGDKIVFRTSSGSTTGQLKDDGSFVGWVPVDVVNIRYVSEDATEAKIEGKISDGLLEGVMHAIYGFYNWSCTASVKFAKDGSVLAEALRTGKDPKLVALERRIAALTSAPAPDNREAKAEVERLQNLRLQEEERLAELRAAISTLQNRQSPKSKFNIPANVNFGDYHALVIGINDYKNLTPLKTAVADAEAIADVLSEKYGFQVTKLINPSRGDILDALDDLRATLKFKDNLLVYYAGHGWLDEKGDEGYWLPANAKKDRRSRWVSNTSITTTLRALEAKHVMIVADGCYSGRLVRDANIKVENAETPEYLSQMSRKKARVAITSGGLEPVEDGRGKHSPFARAFLRTLNENEGVLDGSKLFSTIRRPVMVSANQTPQYSDVRRAGHDGGDFLFVRQK